MAVRLGIFIFFVVTLIAVGILAFSIKNGSQTTQAPQAPQLEQILTAADVMSAGTLVQPADIGSTTVEIAAAPQNAITDTQDHRSAIIGSMNLVTTVTGSAILDDHLIHPGEHGFLAAVLRPGMRAVTINVNDTENANGLVWPGDHVDVILTENTGTFSNPGKSVVSEVLLSNVRVLATGKQLQGGQVGGDSAAPAVASPSSDTMTLEVSPQDALKVEVAEVPSFGGQTPSFSLAVHSASPLDTNAENSAVVPPVWSQDANPALLPPPATTSPPVSTVLVISGGGDGQYNF